jgi:hypothetical protein
MYEPFVVDPINTQMEKPMNLVHSPCRTTPQFPDAHPAIAETNLAAPSDIDQGELPEWWLWPFHYDQKHTIKRIKFGHQEHG